MSCNHTLRVQCPTCNKNLCPICNHKHGTGGISRDELETLHRETWPKYSIKENAERLGVSEQSVINWVITTNGLDGNTCA